MSQNRSSAVMQQRAEPHDSLDDFPTPPWAARALCEHVLTDWRPLDDIAEPACNRGILMRGLADYGEVWGSDIFDYGIHAGVADFLFWPDEPACDWMITNPPFRLAQAFIAKGCRVARKGCAVLVRTSFLEGVGRHDSLFHPSPPTIVAQFAERVPMVKGRCDPEASTATSYCWLVWVHGEAPRPFVWIPPCRRKLERPGDYDPPKVLE